VQVGDLVKSKRLSGRVGILVAPARTAHEWASEYDWLVRFSGLDELHLEQGIQLEVINGRG
jgi:hypothetical protein